MHMVSKKIYLLDGLNQIQINLRDIIISNGIYFIHFVNDDKDIVRKIIVE